MYPKEATDYKLGYYVHLVKGDYENTDKIVVLLVPSRKMARECDNTCLLITKFRKNIKNKDIKRAKNLIKTHRFDPTNFVILIEPSANWPSK